MSIHLLNITDPMGEEYMKVIHFNKEKTVGNTESGAVKAKVTQFNQVFKREKENIILSNVADITFVTIESLIPVKVTSCQERQILICLKSSQETSNYTIITHITNNELIIETKNTEGEKVAEAVLEVTLPEWIFDELLVKTTFGDISVSKGIQVEILELIAETVGNINSQACFRDGNFYTVHGDIDLQVDPVTKVVLRVNTNKGNANIELLNLEAAIISSKTMCGKVNNSYKANGKFLADISVSVMKGDINIK